MTLMMLVGRVHQLRLLFMAAVLFITPSPSSSSSSTLFHRDSSVRSSPPNGGWFQRIHRGGDAIISNDDPQPPPRPNDSSITTTKSSSVIISPSLLACDWSDVKGEIQQCINAGLTHLHIDIFDGVYINSPIALTFGPQMVHAIYHRFVVGNNNNNNNDNKQQQQQQQQQQLVLDVHLCVDRPQRYAQAMVEAGATRIIYQWEAMHQQPNIDTNNNNSSNNNSDSSNSQEENYESNKTILNKAIEFAQEITIVHKLKCGISINPSTDITSIFPLLDTGLIDLVDILAVEPGFGGQEFNPIALTKIKALRHYIDNELRPKLGIDVIILVDGGINTATCADVIHAGADILVAGTALFRHPRGFDEAVKELTGYIS